MARAVQALAVAGDDAVLDGEHLAGGVAAGCAVSPGVSSVTWREVRNSSAICSSRSAPTRSGWGSVPSGLRDGQVDEGGEHVGRGRRREVGADAVRCGERCEERLDVGLERLDSARQRRTARRARVEAEGLRSAPPIGQQVLERDVRLVRAGGRLARWSISSGRAPRPMASSSSRRASSISLRRRENSRSTVVRDPGDLPAAVAARPPADAEAAGELVAHLGGGQRRGGVGVAVEAAGVEGAAARRPWSSTVLATTLWWCGNGSSARDVRCRNEATVHPFDRDRSRRRHGRRPRGVPATPSPSRCPPGWRRAPLPRVGSPESRARTPSDFSVVRVRS